MTRFAFYGRVSTEDHQDPIASRGRQLARARSQIEPSGGEIAAEFFDEGHSRSVPWQRRPQASALMSALRSPDRHFDAIVVGKLARAFGDIVDQGPRATTHLPPGRQRGERRGRTSRVPQRVSEGRSYPNTHTRVLRAELRLSR
jgi:hypothetical protein